MHTQPITPFHIRGIPQIPTEHPQDRETQKAVVIFSIVAFSKRRGRWFDFTFEQYKQECRPIRASFKGEQACLDALVIEDGILDKVGPVYSINDHFFKALCEYISLPVAV